VNLIPSPDAAGAAPDPASADEPLTARELNLIRALRLLRSLDAAALDRAEELVWSLVGRTLKWSYDDPGSLERAQAFAALDPFLRRESEAVDADLAGAADDGLNWA
jgi:hypothetical protein